MINTHGVPRRRAGLRPLAIVAALLPAGALAAVLVLTASQAAGSRAAINAHAHVDPLTRIGVRGSHHGHVAAGTSPSGVAMPTGSPAGWKLIYSDNFDRSVPVGGFSGCTDKSTLMSSSCSGLPKSVSSKLWAYPDGWPDHHFGTYEPSQVVSIHNGVLDYNLHTGSNGTHMVAAVVPKIPGGAKGGGLRYGAYALRFKSEGVPGYKTAFLLWPDSNRWPSDGEIDFPEGNLNGYMGAAMHLMGGTSLQSQFTYPTTATYSGWHTAIIEWTPTICRFILDGRIIGTSRTRIPSTAMHWVLQAETEHGAAPANSAAGHIYIDWVTAYVRKQSTGSGHHHRAPTPQ
jgi:Glycosyl hydrolases family 16